MKNAFPATTVAGSAALPFVISTGAPKERSGEICGPADLSWECFSTGAQPSGEICGFSGPSWKCFSTERTRISYFALLATSTCAALRRESRMQIINATGLHRNPKERSGGTCGSFSVSNFPLVSLHLLHRQSNLKTRLAGLRLYGHETAVHANNPIHHIQSQP